MSGRSLGSPGPTPPKWDICGSRPLDISIAGALCHAASARPVSRPNRSSANRSSTIPWKWNLPPLAVCATGRTEICWLRVKKKSFYPDYASLPATARTRPGALEPPDLALTCSAPVGTSPSAEAERCRGRPDPSSRSSPTAPPLHGASQATPPHGRPPPGPREAAATKVPPRSQREPAEGRAPRCRPSPLEIRVVRSAS
jgi:hypothetical protein